MEKQWKFSTNLYQIIGRRSFACPEYCIDTSDTEKEETEGKQTRRKVVEVDIFAFVINPASRYNFAFRSCFLVSVKQLKGKVW